MPAAVGVGVGVVLLRVSKDKYELLVGLRKNTHGEGTWALPGGWLEQGEQFIDCALRELEEEAGISQKFLDSESIRVLPMEPSNNVMGSVHSVTVFVCAHLSSESMDVTPTVMEPDKCFEWRFVPYDETPQPRFKPLDHLLAKWRPEDS